MAAIITKAYHGYNYVFDEIVDPRVKSWPLLGSPIPGLAMLGLYLVLVFKWGPRFMKNRPAYRLDKVVMVYNAFQIIACSNIFYVGIVEAWGWKYKWVCEPVDQSTSEHAMTVARYCYYYFLLKVIDLLDTIFFVFRKKNNQITFLHVYHHTGMVMLIWGACNYYPGGHGTLVGVINCFVHVVMYGYYLLTIAFPKYKQSMWWKKYITQIQIVQFLWLVIHFTLLVFADSRSCNYPRWSAALFLPQNLFMLILFLDFYIKAYIKKPKAKADAIKRREIDEHDKKHDDGIGVKDEKGNSNGFVKRTQIIESNGTNIKLRS